MLLEGQVNWAWVFAALALLGWIAAAVAWWFARSHHERRASATDQLDVVQRVAKDADRRLFETLNSIPVALVETDRNGKFVFANQAAHELLGRRDAELIGLRFHAATWGITFPDGRPIPPDMLPSARALRGQTIKGFQHMMANPQTRQKMLVSVTALPIENAAGQVIGSTAAIVESEGLATPQTQFYPESEQTSPADVIARRVFDAAPGALVVVGPDGRVRDANATARALVYGDPADADFAELFLSSEVQAAARHGLRQAFASDLDPDPILSGVGEARVQWTGLRLPGDEPLMLMAGERAEAEEIVPLEIEPVAQAPVPESPSVDLEAELNATAERLAKAEQAAAERETALTTAADEAERRAEAALQEAEAARAQARQALIDADAQLAGGRRMETVGRLTGGLAHDFRSLLEVMTGALDMMLHQADDPARVRRIGQAALAAGRKGENLTRQLTAFSEGHDGPVLQVLDAGVLLRGMEGRLRDLAGAGIDLLIEAPSEPMPARLDPVAFDGAVRALTLNAVEAVSGHGSVAVRLETLLEGGLRLSVRDSGPGMDRELAARAIEPFFTTREGSAGLGLSQAYAFARQSGGTISIDSGPGEGAEVSITLPLAA